MNNQNLNDNNLNKVEVQEKTPSLMRETLDKDGNVISPTNNFGPDLADKTINAVESFVETEDHKEKFSEEEVKKYKKNAMLSYLPLVPFYFIFTNKIKTSKYLLFHVNQGLILTILWGVAAIISKLLNMFFAPKSMIATDTTGFDGIVSFIIYCICFFAMVFGIINTYNDSSKEIPLVGKLKFLKGL